MVNACMADSSKKHNSSFHVVTLFCFVQSPRHTPQLQYSALGSAPGLTWERYYLQFQNLGGICEVFVEGGGDDAGIWQV